MQLSDYVPTKKGLVTVSSTLFGLYAGVTSHRLAEAVKKEIFRGMEQKLSIENATRLGARVALGVTRDSFDYRMELAARASAINHDPVRSALQATGFSAFGGKFSSQTSSMASGAVFGLFAGIGLLYITKYIREEIARSNLQTRRLSLNIKRVTLGIGAISGILAYRMLSLNSFEISSFFLSLSIACGVLGSLESLMTYSIFQSSDELRTRYQRIERLQIVNEELREQIQKVIIQRQAASEPLIEPKANTNDEMVCPITGMIIRDPVNPGDGHAYERAALAEWYFRGNTNCPLDPSRRLANPNSMITDTSLKDRITEHLRGMHHQARK